MKEKAIELIKKFLPYVDNTVHMAVKIGPSKIKKDKEFQLNNTKQCAAIAINMVKLQGSKEHWSLIKEALYDITVNDIQQ